MASYRAGVQWIALEDSPGDEGNEEELAGYMTVCLLADLFGKTPAKVAADVMRYRQKEAAEKTRF